MDYFILRLLTACSRSCRLLYRLLKTPDNEASRFFPTTTKMLPITISLWFLIFCCCAAPHCPLGLIKIKWPKIVLDWKGTIMSSDEKFLFVLNRKKCPCLVLFISCRYEKSWEMQCELLWCFSLQMSCSPVLNMSQHVISYHNIHELIRPTLKVIMKSCLYVTSDHVLIFDWQLLLLLLTSHHCSRLR